jgi:ATP-dependent 26S proteasome regulatory subunit
MPKTTKTSSEALALELTIATDASIGLIAVRCHETEVFRVVDEIYALSVTNEQPFRMHTVERGWMKFPRIEVGLSQMPVFNPLEPESDDKRAADVLSAFTNLFENRDMAEGYFVMLDLYFTLDEMRTQFLLRKQVQRALSVNQRVFIIIPQSATIPDAVAPLLHIVDFGYPSDDELRESLSDITRAFENKEISASITDEQMAAIIANGRGMTATAFETAIALSVTDYGNEHGNLTGFGAPEMLRWLRDYKTQLLRKTNVLELQPPVAIEEVGGLELFKKWMVQRAGTYGEGAKELGITPSKGALVVGPPGCKAAGTIIHYKRGKRNSSRSMPIEDFVAKFNGLPVAKSRPWDLTKPTYVQSWDSETGTMFYNRVIGAYASGKKPCIRITTDDDEVVITPEDSVLTIDGTFKRVADVRRGDKLVMRGSMKPMPQGGRSVNRPSIVVEGLKYYDSGWPHVIETSHRIFHYKRQHKARLVIEARMNGLSYDAYVAALRGTPDHPHRIVLPDSREVHHLDGDALNDAISNLEVLANSDHLAQHRDISVANLNVEHTRITKVRKVSVVGIKDTYDLQMEMPAANFHVNNGLIVHNTGKSMLAKAAGSILNLPVIRFDVGRVFGAYIGQSESAMRNVLGMIDAMSPCVLMLDEIDKGFSGMAGGANDGGTTQRVFGTFLTWMQERNQRHRPVFLIMTANRIDNLPPELLRKGRVDEIWAVNVPNAQERRTIFEIHLAKRGQEISEDDLESIVSISENLVGAEIESLCEEALVMCLGRGDTAVDLNDLREAWSTLRPMHKTRAAEFDAMREWAEVNARAASAVNTGEHHMRPLTVGSRGIRGRARVVRKPTPKG